MYSDLVMDFYLIKQKDLHLKLTYTKLLLFRICLLENKRFNLKNN